MRFRCVKKKCCNIIDSVSFANKHELACTEEPYSSYSDDVYEEIAFTYEDADPALERSELAFLLNPLRGEVLELPTPIEYGDMHWMIHGKGKIDFKKEEFRLTPDPNFEDYNPFTHEKFSLINMRGSLAIVNVNMLYLMERWR
ncbi:hypothetical protein Pint_26591 [Pistacia integerrima]|uniref:Uncharacterized protein n=1 Tax=Pistacia integerrima TaxID=434235 RepID=A0ACC0YT30_9ROSI|nr:hypothetical protein Pint_26591 [Pistacia integerrima]